jgi:hypothetical protein
MTSFSAKPRKRAIERLSAHHQAMPHWLSIPSE